MFRLFALTAALALATSAGAQTVDKNGKCHDAKGRFAKAEVCAGKVKTTTTTKASSSYKLDTGGRCRDAKGRMAKKELCAA